MLKRDKYGGKWNVLKVFGLVMERLRSLLEKSSPKLYCIMFADAPKYYVYKACLGFFFGTVMGIAFYEIILVDLAFERGTVYFLGLMFTVLLASGCAASSQIRCITLLTIPSFSGRAGRHIIQAMIVSTIITGPLENITINIEEIMRMYTCSNSMAYNLSQARYDLFVKPFKLAFLGTKVNTEELRDMLGSVNSVVEPFAQEIEGVDDLKFIQEENDYMDEQLNDTKRSTELENKYRAARNKRDLGFSLNKTKIENETAEEYQKQYFKKLETRCENVKTGMGKMCKKRFQQFKQRCEDAVHWAISWAVCWPMKLEVICDLVKVFTYGGYDCDPSKEVSNSIGGEYVSLRNAEDRMQSGIAGERTQYKLIKPPNLVALHSAITITKEFTHEIYTKKKFADSIMTLVKTMLAFMFILVIRSAAVYHNDFINFTNHDNFYVTADFRVLDARRRKCAHQTVLPSTKAEQKRLADPYSLCLSSPEKAVWGKEFSIIVILTLACGLVLFMDYALAKSLLWIEHNLEFSYTESGHHRFKIDVQGTGFVAAIVRSIIKGFDFKKDLTGDVTNKACLTKASFLTYAEYTRVLGSCGFLCLVAYCEGYIKRLRRAICAFYYREQEKRRIETLYKKTLAYRERLFEGKIKELYRKAKKTEIKSDLRLLYRLQRNFPRCTFLRLLPSSRPVCVTCEEQEARFAWMSPRHLQCNTCKSFYCVECWINFYNTCHLCTFYEKIKLADEDDVV